MIIMVLEVKGMQCFQASEDADFLIALTAIQQESPMLVLATDTNVL